MLILRSLGYRAKELLDRTSSLWPRPSALRTIVGALIAALFVGGIFFMTTRATNVNVLANGNLEGGFYRESCGDVGNNWNCFTNGGDVTYGFYDEQWTPVVSDGSHGQLIEMNTFERPIPDPDRYAGIYQTVNVPSGAQCTFSMRGMIRTTKFGGDPWRYRVQFGTSYGGDWRSVNNWIDVGWDTYYDRLAPGEFSSFTHDFTTSGNQQNVYVRFWKKWGIPEEEVLLNLDSIALTCPSGGHAPAATATPYHHPTATPYHYPTATPYHYHYPTPTPYYVHPTATPYVHQPAPHKPSAPQAHGCTRIVRAGESLGVIAQGYGVTLHQVVQANAISNPDWIYVGQKLYIPHCSGYNPPMVQQPVVHPTVAPTVYVPPTATPMPTHVAATATPTHLPATATPAEVCAGYHVHEGVCYPKPWTGDSQYGCFLTVEGPVLCIDPPAPSAPTAVATIAPTNTRHVIVVTATPTTDPCECDRDDEPVAAPTATPTTYVAPTVAPSVAPSATPTATPTKMAHRTYRVRHGNTLSHIAQHYGVSMHSLMHLNGIYDADHIYIGQVLLIPHR